MLATPNEPQEQLDSDSVPIAPNKPQEQLDSNLGDMRFYKVYTRRKMANPEPVQVQESNSNSLNEVTISNPSLQE